MAKKPLYCSFCGKERSEVFYIVEALAAGICNECVPGNLRPTKLASYRGFYEDLALDFEIGEPCPLVQLLDECRRAIGRQFEGYKGGLYTATRDTAIWCSHWGQAQNLVVTGIREIYEGYYGLETKVVDL